MGGLTGIRQSVERANRLLSEGILGGLTREFETEGFRRNRMEAWRELAEAADELSSSLRGREYYAVMGPALRDDLWHAIFLSQDVADGQRIMSALGAVGRLQVPRDVRATSRAMVTESKGYSDTVLTFITYQILAASYDTGTMVERRAAQRGDPAPPPISEADAELYYRLITSATFLASSGDLAEEARNPKLAAFMALIRAFLPSESSGFTTPLTARVQGTGMSATTSAGPGLAFAAVQGTISAVGVYTRGTAPSERFRVALDQAALRESGGNAVSAGQLIRRVADIEQQEIQWARWLDRHRDHPLWSPPGGEYRDRDAW